MTSPPRGGLPRGTAARSTAESWPDAEDVAGVGGGASLPARDAIRRGRIDRLLRDLGADLRRGGPPGAGPDGSRCPTGLPEVDHLLGGGLPHGRVSEIAGPPSSGRTSLALALLARTTRAGQWAAWLDVADAFDPASAADAGVDLARVLWVRPRDLRHALRSAEPVLETGGFALVALDGTEPIRSGARPPGAGGPTARADGRDTRPGAARPRDGVPEGRTARPGDRVPDAAWSRLRHRTAATDTALLVLGERRRAGAFADLAVEMEAAHPRFARGPDWLEGLEGRIRVVRSRTGPDGRVAAVRWRMAEAAA